MLICILLCWLWVISLSHWWNWNIISARIFAYEQTSSGKTHTTSGITEYAVRDIYSNPGFTLQWNGWCSFIVAEILTFCCCFQHKDREFVVSDWVGIYFIIKLQSNWDNSSHFLFLSNWVGFFVQNFVDLAGSERASQAMTAGTTLRECSHINRSLLSLGTVIRKLR